MLKKYEFIEHTADLGFKAYGATLEELFTNAAAAFSEAMVALEDVSEGTERSIEVEADAPDDLMVSWLSELLYLFDTERLLFKRFQVKRQRGQGQVKTLTDGSCRHPVRSDLHQIAKDSQTGLLSQGTECDNNGFFFHISNFIDIWK